jgi:hypothetical protein
MSETQTATDAAVRKAMEDQNLLPQIEAHRGIQHLFIQGVVTNLLGMTPEVRCYLVSYHSAVLNVRSIIRSDSPSHFQAVAMLGRNLFELAVETRLAEVIPSAAILAGRNRSLW